MATSRKLHQDMMQSGEHCTMVLLAVTHLHVGHYDVRHAACVGTGGVQDDNPFQGLSVPDTQGE